MAARALCVVLAVLLSVFVSACSSSNVRRDMDVSGSLPRAIGLGAFSPACVMFCFPSSSFTQGDVTREVIEEGEPFVVHSATTQEKTKGGGVSIKSKSKQPPKTKGPKS